MAREVRHEVQVERQLVGGELLEQREHKAAVAPWSTKKLVFSMPEAMPSNARRRPRS